MTSSKKVKLFAALLICATYMPSVARAHGRMLDPPSRMSAYLLGFPTPVNYNDHQMFCGGRAVQWQQNGGKCGVCGDPWSGPRDYERPNGALLPKNLVVTKTYQESDVINIVLQITANHMGWHEFRLCDIERTGGVEATAECLDENVLANASGNSRFYFESSNTGFYNYTLVLPAGLTCNRCLLQWKWHCGNDWGCDERGCGVGFGIVQEEFYACSDVVISPRNGSFAPFTTTTSSSPAPAGEPQTTQAAPEAATTTSLPDVSIATPQTNDAATPRPALEVTVSPSIVDAMSPSPPSTQNPKSNPITYKPYFQYIIENMNSSSTTSENKLLYYKNPEFVKMLQGFPNTYNSVNASQSTPFNSILNMLKPQTPSPALLNPVTPSPPITALAKDRICAFCFFGCKLTLCPTTCPALCPAGIFG